MPRLLVLGGSGFVGKAVCQAALSRGWTVSSLSRTGAPAGTDALLDGVQWHKGSALDVNVMKEVLAGQDYVAHCIGTLLESNPLYLGYKQVSQAQSYDALNRDTALIALQAATESQIKAMAYVSANGFGHVGEWMLPRYLETKRQAERALLDQSVVRPIVLRPGFLYGPERSVTYPIALGNRLVSLFSAGFVPRPLSVHSLAQAILNSLETVPPMGPVLEITDIELMSQPQ